MCPSNVDERLSARLIEWRDATAAERGVPTFVVFTDVTMRAVAERRPGTEKDLLDIPGIPRSKMRLYGDQLLAIVAEARASAEPAHALGAVTSVDITDAARPATS